jgi:hypothetical protein
MDLPDADRPRVAAIAHAENAESRSWSRYRGALFHGNASRNCCAVHAAVG